MRRSRAALGSAAFFCLVPGSVAGLVPWLITRWHVGPPVAGLVASRWLGGALIVVGLPPLIGAFVRFAWHGLGTPAPIAPPSRLVVGGCYRHVRNPMYVGVLLMLVGQTLLFADHRVLEWAAGSCLFMHLFVVFYEEPTLIRRFGSAYTTYRASVPRWLPRLRPWNPDARH